MLCKENPSSNGKPLAGAYSIGKFHISSPGYDPTQLQDPRKINFPQV
jgi:hypothetical protein